MLHPTPNWAAYHYDDSAGANRSMPWRPAVDLGAYGGSSLQASKYPTVSGSPGQTGQWGETWVHNIKSESSTAGTSTVPASGIVRREYNVTRPGTYTLYGWTWNAGTFYFDGVQVLATTSQSKLGTVSVTLTAGPHTLGIAMSTGTLSGYPSTMLELV